MIDNYPSSLNCVESIINSSRSWKEIPGTKDKSPISIEVDYAATELIEHLGLSEISKESTDEEKTKALQEIFVELAFSSVYDESVMAQKQTDGHSLSDMRLLDVRRSLIDHRVVCSSDAATFTYLADKLGVECYDLTIGRDDASGAHQVNVYRLSPQGNLMICDITKSRTFNMPIFDIPIDEYLDAISKDEVKPRVIFNNDTMSVLDPLATTQKAHPKRRLKPKIATEGLFYSEDLIEKMIISAREINRINNSSSYTVTVHKESIQTSKGTNRRVTLGGDWLTSGDASDLWRYIDQM